MLHVGLFYFLVFIIYIPFFVLACHLWFYFTLWMQADKYSGDKWISSYCICGENNHNIMWQKLICCLLKCILNCFIFHGYWVFWNDPLSDTVVFVTELVLNAFKTREVIAHELLIY